jgi:hypothetical protein
MFSPRKSSLLLLVFLVLVLVTPARGATPASSPAAPGAEPAAPEAVQTTPTPVIDNESYDEWTIGGSLAYWKANCTGGEFPQNGHLRRIPANGGNITTMVTMTPASANCNYMYRIVANDAGMYYFNTTQNRIELLKKSAPLGPPAVIYSSSSFPIPVAPPKLDETNIYWATANNIHRAALNGSGGLTMVATGLHVKDLVVSPTHIYWLDDTGMWAIEKNCATAPICASTKVKMQTTTGRYLLYHAFLNFGSGPNMSIYWVDTSATPERIRRIACTAPTTCTSATTVYTAPTDHPWKIGQLLRTGFLASGDLYWTEQYVDTGRGGNVRRMSGSAAPVNLADQLQYLGEQLFADSLGLYFSNSSSVYRLPFDATALVHDLAVDAWEVTQGIQSTANDVPLVAGKTTYVRVYGKQLSGTMAGSVQAQLRGTRNGVALPGSPLTSLSPSEALVTGSNPITQRVFAGTGWMFKLPKSWTDPGSITLKVEIDPKQSYSDPNTANNSKTQTFSFTKKAPACTIFVPVRTDASGAYWVKSSIFYPNSEAMLDLFKRLWPVSGVWTYWQSEPIEELGFFNFSPYEIPEDNWKIMASMMTRQAFSDDPDECDDVNASVHYVGVVVNATNTSTGPGTSQGGYANYVFNVSWVKFPPYSGGPGSGPSWTWPRAGSTMAQELTHNYWRVHIGCQTTAEDFAFPYPVCQLDNVGDTKHFGFDVNSQTPIAPDGAADYMTYANTRWVSDYTWKAMFTEMDTIGLQNSQARATINEAAAPDLSLATASVMVSGILTPSLNQGSMNYAWVYPTAALSQNALERWQRWAAPTFDAASRPAAQPGHEGHQHSHGADASTLATYHVRLLDAANTVLADQSFIPSDNDTHAEDGVPTASFVLTFPAPAGTVAKAQLMIDSQVVATMAPGTSAPTVSITSPAGGEAMSDSMTVSWQASDADAGDRLHYTVQYSPDMGQSWVAVASDIVNPAAGNTMSLELKTLSALAGSSTGSLIRVLASDGYNTTVATSQPFNVPNHAPDPVIISPAPESGAVAGDVVVLRGGARDTEDGTVDDAKLTWTLNGTPIGAGEEQTLAGLAPGTYDLALTAQDSLNKSATVHTDLVISKLFIPSGGTPALDGVCDDSAYTGSKLLALAPYSDGTQAEVHLVRTSTSLWACFTNMKTGVNTSMAGLHVDVNNSRDGLAQADDFGFFVGEDGTPTVVNGTGSGTFAKQPAEALATSTSASATGWNAELRIDASALGGWNHIVGLNVEQFAVSSASDRYSWPYAAALAKPNTWAPTLLGAYVYTPLLMK